MDTQEIRAALLYGVEVIDDVLRVYGVPWRAAEKLEQLKGYHLSLLEEAAAAPPTV